MSRMKSTQYNKLTSWLRKIKTSLRLKFRITPWCITTESLARSDQHHGWQFRKYVTTDGYLELNVSCSRESSNSTTTKCQVLRMVIQVRGVDLLTSLRSDSLYFIIGTTSQLFSTPHHVLLASSLPNSSTTRHYLYILARDRSIVRFIPKL